MKRLVFAAIAAVVINAAPAAAQASFQHPMYTNVDVVSANVVFGWSIDANTGAIPQAVTLWRIDGPSVTQVPTNVYVGARPDVQAWASSAGFHGGAVNANLGFGIVPVERLAPGDYVVLVTDMPYAWSCTAAPGGGVSCGYVANVVPIRVN